LFFSPPRKKKKKETPPTLHIAKAPRANAQTKALSKSAILPTHTEQLDNFILIFEINMYFS
jgi:hypothetical protein